MEKMRKLLPSFADFVSISGISMLGYGLYQVAPWICFSVVGSLLIVAGVRLGRTEVAE